MFRIVHNVIYHRRGDTGGLDASSLTVDGIKLSDLTQPYTAIFSLKKSVDDAQPVLQKQMVMGQIYLLHADTQGLSYGDYVYDVQVHIDDGTAEGRYGTIGPYAYHLLPDVTTT